MKYKVLFFSAITFGIALSACKTKVTNNSEITAASRGEGGNADIEGGELSFNPKKSKAYRKGGSIKVIARSTYGGEYSEMCWGQNVSGKPLAAVLTQLCEYFTVWEWEGGNQVTFMYSNRCLAIRSDFSLAWEVCNEDSMDQRFNWYKNGGWGDIRPQNYSNHCLDVTGGDINIYDHNNPQIGVYKCKAFTAGPAGIGQNQRFWLSR